MADIGTMKSYRQTIPMRVARTRMLGLTWEAGKEDYSQTLHDRRARVSTLSGHLAFLELHYEASRGVKIK